MEKKPQFISKVTMDKEKYNDVTMITFAKYTAFVQIVGIGYAVFYIYQMMENQDARLLCINSAVLFVLTLLMYLSLKRNKVEKFEKSFRMADGTALEYITKFYDDEMEVCLSSGASVTYKYDLVNAVKEAKGLYFIEMPKDYHIVVSKELECEEKRSFTEFMLEKCNKMREKRVVDIRHEEKNYQTVMFGFAAALVIAAAMMFMK